MSLVKRLLMVVAIVMVGTMSVVAPAQALTKQTLQGSTNGVTMPDTNASCSAVTYSTITMPQRYVKKVSQPNPQSVIGAPTDKQEHLSATYRIWRWDAATSKWILALSKTRTAFADYGQPGAYVPGLYTQLSTKGWYYTDVTITWQRTDGTVIGKALYKYDQVADYTTTCTTWQGNGIAAVYL